MSGIARFWAWVRYKHLLPFAAKSRPRGRFYALVAGTVDYWLDRPRRTSGAARARRWLSVPAPVAFPISRAVVRNSLVVEAQEEADSVFLIRHPGEFRGHLPGASELPPLPARTVFATIHTGAHVFAYAYLRKVCRLNVRAIARPLGPDNLMPDAKRRYAEKKLAWLHMQLGVDFLGTDLASLAFAREHLLGGNPIFATFDASGDLASRTQEVCDERLVASSGVATLARLTESMIVPLVAIWTPQGVRVHFGNPVPPGEADPLPAVFRQLENFIRRFPDHWSLWPYVQAAQGPAAPARWPEVAAAPRVTSAAPSFGGG
ncbi:MAG: hypothetical protein P8R42_28650 [Candidatus Binatia bacterium]|nr:hypothetical protein [Candidatus Binatia bacterium]